MLELLVASMVMVSDAVPEPTIDPARLKGLVCRPVVSGVSKSNDITVCRTKADWRRREGCTGVTRYCSRANGDKLGPQTAFALSEDNRIICRSLKQTGSRLIAHKICLPNREWARMFVDSSDTTRRMQEQSTRARDLGQ